MNLINQEVYMPAVYMFISEVICHIYEKITWISYWKPSVKLWESENPWCGKIESLVIMKAQ